MTDILLDPNDSGECVRLVGETTHHITAEQRAQIIADAPMPDAPGEATQNLNPYLIPTNPWPVVIRREVEDTEIVIAETIAVVDLPLTASADLAAAQPVAPWERVVGPEDTAVHSILDSLAGPQKPPPPLPKPKLSRSVPVAAMVDREPPGWPQRAAYKGRRRKPEERRVSPWVALAAVLVVGLAMWAGLYLAAHAVLAVVR